ncbi:MAG: hypothetical protein JKP92_01585 [Alphaproteobacteria bacterium]|jgi:hypothetical protein|nr:hypothetical protein [Alphaproteobacteria bacterium]
MDEFWDDVPRAQPPAPAAEAPAPAPEREETGTLEDFMVYKGPEDISRVKVAAREDGRVVVFHSRPFVEDLAYLEFDLGTGHLTFLREDGAMRDFGTPIPAHMAKNMQNTHQVFLVLMDEATGQGVRGRYVPLIVHRSGG